MGCLLAQLCGEPIKEIVIEYAGDFQDLDLSPVTTAVLKGLLTPMVKDDVNFVNAEVLAKERGIKVTAITIGETEQYINLITVQAISAEETNKVAGTIFGKQNPRVVNINNFRLELRPEGRNASRRASYQYQQDARRAGGNWRQDGHLLANRRSYPGWGDGPARRTSPEH